MRCMVCGTEMNNTVGGNYTCPSCGHTVNDLVNRPSNFDMPIAQGFGEQKGWICPVCGRGLAPWMNYCPCQGSEIKITYGTSTGVNNDFDINEYIKYAAEHLNDLDGDVKL